MPAVPEVFEVTGVEIDEQESDPEFTGDIVTVFKTNENTGHAGNGRNDSPVEKTDLFDAVPFVKGTKVTEYRD